MNWMRYLLADFCLKYRISTRISPGQMAYSIFTYTMVPSCTRCGHTYTFVWGGYSRLYFSTRSACSTALEVYKYPVCICAKLRQTRAHTHIQYNSILLQYMGWRLCALAHSLPPLPPTQAHNITISLNYKFICRSDAIIINNKNPICGHTETHVQWK